MILHAQLEIWKAAYSESSTKQWIPEAASGNASSGDISEGKRFSNQLVERQKIIRIIIKPKNIIIKLVSISKHRLKICLLDTFNCLVQIKIAFVYHVCN